MTKEEIEDILLQLSYKSDNDRAAVAAFNALYRGYSKFLSSVISNVLLNRGIYDKDFIETVLNNSFLVVYQKPLSFAFLPESEDDKSFKAWLATVAKNQTKKLLLEYYTREDSLEVVTAEPIYDSEEIPEEVFMSANFKILDGALASLNERDRHILLTLYLYYEEGKKTPSNVLSMLCNLYNTTNLNIRKIKERSEKKIVEYLSKRSQLIPLKNVK